MIIHQPGEREEIISYRKLRSLIGITGVLLPVLLVLGSFITGAGSYAWQPSISHYYYSSMHIVFVGLLSVLGGFLLTYKGKSATESRVSNLAGACAFGVAAFPTKLDHFRSDGSTLYLQLCNEISRFMNGVHYAIAALLLLCFVIFCLIFFQQPDGECKTEEEIKKFRRRKKFYTTCGYGILTSMIIIAYFSFINKQTGGVYDYTTFIFETTSLWFFGTAWLVKGSAMWVRTPVMRSVVKPIRQVPQKT